MSNKAIKGILVIVFVIIIKDTIGQCDDVSEASFVVIRGNTTTYADPVKIPWSSINALLSASYYDNNKPTTVYAHGFTESLQSPSVQNVIKAYMSRRSELNIFIIDWSMYSQGNYILQAIPNMFRVSARFGFNFQFIILVLKSLSGW